MEQTQNKMDLSAKCFKIYARAVITNSAGQVLMLKKHDNQKIGGGRWLLPGGTIEFGETPQDGLRRELQEEVNFVASDFVLIDCETRIIGNVHWLGLIFKVSGDVSLVKNNEPDKHAELKWCLYE
jgi:mutator protein MutT